MHIYRSFYNDDPHHTAYDNAMTGKPKLAPEPSKTLPTALKTTFVPIHPQNLEKEI
jgi:hypothetical protein